MRASGRCGVQRSRRVEPRKLLSRAPFLGARAQLARRLILGRVQVEAQRCGVSRREFLHSAAGTAVTLSVIELINACSGSRLRDGLPAAGQAGSATGGVGGSSAGATGETAGSLGLEAGQGGAGGTGAPIPQDAGPLGDGAVAGRAPDAGSPMGSPLCGAGAELIIDANTSFITPPGAITHGLAVPPRLSGHAWNTLPDRCHACSLDCSHNCFTEQDYVDHLVAGSETSMAILGTPPYRLGADGTGFDGGAVNWNERVLEVKHSLVERFGERFFARAEVMPSDRLELQLQMMEQRADAFGCWGIDPTWQLTGDGVFLSDPAGQQVLQKGIELGRPVFFVRKGLIDRGTSAAHHDPADIGDAAQMFPEAFLVVQHSAFENGFAPGESSRPDPDDPDADVGWGPGVGHYPEGPYDEQDAGIQARYPLDRGVNSLIRALRRAGIGANGHTLDGSGPAKAAAVYAECSGVWAELMVGRRDEAMHYWGKLLKHVGEDRILWGSQGVFYGSPQPLIAGFRAFEISAEFQERYGYPPLTQAVKEKILGRNAASLLGLGTAGVAIEGCHGDHLAHHRAPSRLYTRRGLLALG